MRSTDRALRADYRLLGIFALVKLLIHLLVGEGYGYFRDEFYYLACSDHLDWGYVDHPPLSILLLWLSRSLLGESVVAIRLLPAVAGAATVYLVGWMTGRLGGSRFAQILAMTSTLVAPVYLGVNAVFSMNSFDVFFWALAAALLVRLFQEDDPRIWLWLGVVLGLGLQNKMSVLWLGFGLLVALLVTSQRRSLLQIWPWAAAATALVVFLPHLIWQILYGWPTLEFIRNATTIKMLDVSPLQFLWAQLRIMHPLNLPVAIAGLYFLLFSPRGRQVRPLGWIYLSVLVLLILSGTSRPGYLAPAYTFLFASGGVIIERWSESWRQGFRVIVLAVLLAGGVALAPLALPILPVETYIRYAALIGQKPTTSERKELRELPQHYADMFGWKELISELSKVFTSLPPQDQQVAGIFVLNYGEAGAIDLLGRDPGLPLATSGHNNYWLWGPRGYSGEVLIIVGGSKEDHQEGFEQVEEVGRTRCRYCMPYEDDQPIFVVRGLKFPLEAVWPSLKHFD